MRTLKWVVLMLFAWQAHASPAPLYTFRDLASGYVTCPPAARNDPLRQKALNCEASAAAYSEKIQGIYIAADWWSRTALPSLFSVPTPLEDGVEVQGQVLETADTLGKIKKIEGMTKTEDNQLIIGTTSFTHFPGPAVGAYDAWDEINKVFYWPAGLTQQIRFPDLQVNGNRVTAQDVSSEEYSGYLREAMLTAIRSKYPEVFFFKVEGLSTLPGNKLAFGIREIGTDFRNPEYKVILLITDFAIEDGSLVISTDFRLKNDFSLRERFKIPERIGLSSIEYDYQRNRLYIMTSYEEEKNDEGMGAYLWVSTVNKQTGQLARPKSVVDNNLKYFHFAHKGEGLAIDSTGNIILIADDDRVRGRDEKDITDSNRQFSRKTFQAAYKVLRITPRKLKSVIPH